MKKFGREKEKELNKGRGILSALASSKKRKAQGTSHAEEITIRKPSFGLIGRVLLDESLIAQNK